MLRSSLSLFILVVGCANSILSQQVRPLPTPVINIQCGRASILRHTGLVPPPGNQQVPQTCTYTIHALSLMICQIRLDFTRFSLAQPTINGMAGSAFPKCTDGYLQVGNITLCGENSGQHIYVPINPRLPSERQLKITIVSNGNGMANGRQDWNIAVHQFECPFGQSRLQNSVQAASESENVGVNRQPRTFISDWLAPPGCLQYHANPSGMVETFNFNNGAGPYIGDMNYAICFRRARGNFALQLTRTFFQMGITNPDPDVDGVNDECFEPERLTTTGRSEDFLFVPHALVDFPPLPANASDPQLLPPQNGNRRLRATRFCGQSLNKALGPIVSTPPGPFSIAFNADDQYYPGIEIGFRMQYQIV